MQLSDISLWGLLLLIALTAGVLALFAFVNRSMMQRLLRVLTFLIINMVALGGMGWALCWLGQWWATALWGLLMTVGAGLLAAAKVRQPQKVQPWEAVLATLSGQTVATGSLLACFGKACSTELFIAIVLMTGVQLCRSLPPSLMAFIGSLRHTKAHILYLQANGASQLESLMPSVRRGLRAAVLPLLGDWVQPLVVTPPLLLCGLLLSGCQPLAAVCATTACLLAALAGCMTAAVTAVWLVGRRWLKDAAQTAS